VLNYKRPVFWVTLLADVVILVIDEVVNNCLNFGKQEIFQLSTILTNLDELELLCKYASRYEAEEVGRKMKRRLAAIDNDTDDFEKISNRAVD
jgi:hypothetical protein